MLTVTGLPVGTLLEGTIQGKPFKGRLGYQKDWYYIAQNVIEGRDTWNKMGYKYTWSVKEGDARGLQEEKVEITSITLDPDFKQEQPVFTIELNSEIQASYYAGKKAVYMEYGGNRHEVSFKTILDIAKRLS